MTRRHFHKARIIGRTLFRITCRIKHPRLFVDWVRFIYAAEQDFHFERSSPLPLLPQDFLDRIQAFEVVLPPGNSREGGNQSLEGLAFLSSLARALGVSTAFEIGTYNGVTAWCLSRNKADLAVHTLDIPPRVAPLLPLAADDVLNLRSHEQPKMYEVFPTQGEIFQHWGDSATFDFGPWRGKCELIYVDGAHSAEYVENDSRIALDLMSRRAAVVWDDYWPMVPGVPAILDHLTQVTIHRVPGTRLAIHLTEEAISYLLSTHD